MKNIVGFVPLLMVASATIAAATVNAAELKSFLGVNFGESVSQDKFVAFDDALKSKGMSPSDIHDPTTYAVLKGTYIYKLLKPFKTHTEVLVRANSNGEVYYVGFLDFFKHEQYEEKMRECFDNARWIISTYGNDAIKITDKTYPDLYTRFKDNVTKGVGDSAVTAELFFGFQNGSGNFPSQIITSSVICDSESGRGVLAMVAEDIALENATAHKTQINGQSGKSNAPQLSRAKALLAKDKAKKEAAEESRQKGLDSFCGIDFGSVVNGEMYRTDGGQYLTCVVRLKTPFRGHEAARVYASVKSRRIFRIDMEGFCFDSLEGGNLIAVVSKRYGFEPVSHTNPFQRITDSYEWRFSNALIRFYFDYSNKRGDELWNSFNKSGVLSAISHSWEHFANDEFQKESGGDGSSVL